MTLTQFGTILGVMTPFLLLAGGWVLNKRLQKANAAKAEAEAALTDAQTDKAHADVSTAIIANTKALLAEARTVQAEKDAVKDERIFELKQRADRLENRFESLRAALATHGVWDAAAIIDLKTIKPDYPSPPPFPAHSQED